MGLRAVVVALALLALPAQARALSPRPLAFATARWARPRRAAPVQQLWPFSRRAGGTPARAAAAAPAAEQASLKPYIETLLGGGALSASDTEAAWGAILRGADPVQVGSLLCLLRQKGETADEVAGMVRGMRAACVPVSIDGKLLSDFANHSAIRSMITRSNTYFPNYGVLPQMCEYPACIRCEPCCVHSVVV